MIVWVKEHPILASLSGLMLIVLLYVVLHRGGSSAQQVSTNPGGVSDSAYTAQLAAGAQSQQTSAALQVSQDQTAAAITLGLAQAQNVDNQTAAARDVALQQTLSGASVAQYSAAATLQGQQANYSSQVQQTQLQTGAAVQIAGIQGEIAKDTSAKQLTLGLDTNKTALGLASYSYQSHISDNNTAGAIAALDAQTAVQINQQNETTKQVAIGTQGAIEQNALNQQGQAVADQFALAQQHEQNITDLFKGVNTYGGNLSSNQATVETAIIGQPSVGQAIQQSSASQAQSSASLWSNIVAGIVGGATKVATAGLA